MSQAKNDKKKSFNIKEYKGYVAVLIGLFIILFVLIGIAVGMIKDYYGADVSEDVETDIETEVQTSVDETESIVITPIETESAAATQKETETESDVNAKETTETENIPEDVVVDKEDPLLILVNKDHPIPEDIEYKLVRVEENHYVDERVYYDLLSMISDAKKAGHKVLVCSSWRSHNLQTELYKDKIDEYLSYGYSKAKSEELAAFWVALPGTSEHEIGLAVDIVAEKYQHLDHEQANTKEQKWLMEHCHEYGFILRYPEDKQDITHIGYEPWHYRYVGKEAAKDIAASGLCLEEYLGTVNAK